MCSTEVIRSVHADTACGDPATPDPGDGAPALAVPPEVLGRLRRVRDLTHTLTPDFPVFPGYPSFRARSLAAVEHDGYASSELRLVEHVGTHLDATAHFSATGATADAIPAEQLLAQLVVVCIAERAARDPDALLGVDDLRAWERRHGRIPPGAVVAMHSGWEARLSEPGRFLNADAAGTLHSPGFAAEAMRFLVEERDVAGAATDTLSLDPGTSTTYDAHRVLLPAGKYGLENVASLGRVPPAGAVVVVGGPKHADATGGPARLLALF
ncbi:MAG TPA: cyclase family protein [Longimicrobiaceae bacterium]|nr:cyclase family protein [Longimicrobiaceae bacterium]